MHWTHREVSKNSKPVSTGTVPKFSKWASAVPSCYGSRAIRKRIAEFLGGTNAADSPTAYITASDGTFSDTRPSSTQNLRDFLAAGLEIDRSLWDRDSLIADIDLEYHNFDNPAAAWQDPERAFGLQQPVLEATLRILGEAGIAPLTLMSGRGFHLVWSVGRDSLPFRSLAALGSLTPGLDARYARAKSPAGYKLDPQLGRAFAGLGRLMEFVFQRVLNESQPSCEIPVHPAAIEIGPGIHGREIVSFDLSEYGDPLDNRRIRVPFSIYLKPRQFRWMLGQEQMSRLMPIFEIPLAGMHPREAAAVARDPDAVLALAERVNTRIPDASTGMGKLLDQYRNSKLASFHEEFEEGVRRIDFSVDPALEPPAVPCLTWPLEHANDWLLRPGVIQHAVRVLMALNWHPLSIVQLISASFRRDCDWGDTWTRIEPWSRAIFYTRLFAGMIATGADPLVDMNCVSHKEKGYCMVPDCSSNLASIRDMLLERRVH